MKKALGILVGLICLSAVMGAWTPIFAADDIFAQGRDVFYRELRTVSGLDPRASRLLPGERETLAGAGTKIPFLYEAVVNLTFIREDCGCASPDKSGDPRAFREAYFGLCRKSADMFFNSLFVEALNKTALLGCPENAGRGRLELVLGSLGLAESVRPAHYEALAGTPPDVAEGWGFAAANFGEALKLSGGQGIKVALIDTGLDTSSSWIKGATAIRPSEFCPAVRRNAPWIDGEAVAISDPVGRGTVLSWIISKCAPKADIHIYRIAGDAEPAYSFWTAYQLALAIDRAAADGNDIVVIGFVLDRDFCFLKKSCQEAYRRNVVLIAPSGSFSTGNPETEASFPAHYNSVISAVPVVPDGQGKPVVWDKAAASHHAVISAPAVFLKGSAVDPSMASAAVGGLSALIAERIPKTSRDLSGQYVQRIYTVLTKSADPAALGFTCFDSRIGYGLIDAASATGKTVQAYLIKMKQTDEEFDKRMKKRSQEYEAQKKREAAEKKK